MINKLWYYPIFFLCLSFFATSTFSTDFVCSLKACRKAENILSVSSEKTKSFDQSNTDSVDGQAWIRNNIFLEIIWAAGSIAALGTSFGALFFLFEKYCLCAHHQRQIIMLQDQVAQVNPNVVVWRIQNVPINVVSPLLRILFLGRPEYDFSGAAAPAA